MDDLTPEEIADGIALFQEHSPQSGPDWVAVAERVLAAGDDGSKGSPPFHALCIAVAQRDAASRAKEAGDA